MGRKPRVKKVESEGPITTAKVRMELMRKANMVVLHRKKKNPEYSLQEYIDSILGPVIDRDYEGFLREESGRG